MNRKQLIATLLIGLFILTGCARLSKVTAPNKKNLSKLSIGMTKQEAINVMGNRPMTAYHGLGPSAYAILVNNPYRSEILQGVDKTFEVIYYLTDAKTDGVAITDDELTPLVFDNGKLIAWGWGIIDDGINKYEIRPK